MAKTCKRCGEEKPLSEFTKHPGSKDGLAYWCRSCFAERWRERISNPATVKADRERQRRYIAEKRKDPKWGAHKRAILRKYCEAHRKFVCERQKVYAAKYRAVGRKRQRDPFKDRARDLLKIAVRSGKIERATACSRCGSSYRVQAHHHDYSKPYDVVWLCQICHGREHRIAD